VRTIHRWDPESGSAGALVYEVPTILFYWLGSASGLGGGPATSLVPELSASDLDRFGRLCVTDQRAYRIDLFDPSGLVRSVRRGVELRSISDSDADYIVEATLHTWDTTVAGPTGAGLRASGRAPEIRRQMAARYKRNASLPLPDFVPPLGRLLVSLDGSFWVERADLRPIEAGFVDVTGGSIVPAHETTWDVFDVDGVFIGSAKLPARFRAESVDGLTVVGVWADEFDVQYVLRLEVSATE
jgi:hypothetical protein